MANNNNIEMVAKVRDQATGPLNAIRKSLNDLGQSRGAIGLLQREFGALNATMARLATVTNALKTGAAAAAIGVLANSMKAFSERALDLSHLSRETGFATREIKAFTFAAERMRIAPEAAQAGLQRFSETLHGLKNNMPIAGELARHGLAPLVAQLGQLGREGKNAEALVETLKAIERLDKQDPMLAGMLSEKFFGTRDFRRVQASAFADAMKDVSEQTKEATKNAQEFLDTWLKSEKAIKRTRDLLLERGISGSNDALSVFSQLSSEKLKQALGAGTPEGFAGVANERITALRERVAQIDKSLAAGAPSTLAEVRSKLLQDIEALERGKSAAEAFAKGARESEKKIEQEGESAGRSFWRWLFRMSATEGFGQRPLVVPASLPGGGFSGETAFSGFRPGLRGPAGSSLAESLARGSERGQRFAALPPPTTDVPGAPSISPSITPPLTPPKDGKYSDRVKWLADNLSRDFNLSRDQAIGVAGALSAESGLQAINEKRPLIPGSRGGFGWAQWTGPRRRAFEAWAAKNNLDIRSPEANYGFLRHELEGAEGKGTLPGLRNALTAQEAQEAFTRKFLRPGIPHWQGRADWTRRAEGAYRSTQRIDAALAAQTHRFEGAGKITVDVNAPKGTKVTGEASGVFREIEINRGMQMAPAIEPRDLFDF